MTWRMHTPMAQVSHDGIFTICRINMPACVRYELWVANRPWAMIDYEKADDSEQSRSMSIHRLKQRCQEYVDANPR